MINTDSSTQFPSAAPLPVCTFPRLNETAPALKAVTTHDVKTNADDKGK